MKEKFKTSIGGQALIEGIMMRGPQKTAMAVRKPDQSIHLEEWETAAPKWYNKVPFLRGIFNMVSSLMIGYKCLMRSAEIAGMEEEEPSKFENWLAEKLGIDIMTIVAVIAVIFGAALAILLFVIVPTGLAGIIHSFFPSNLLRSVVEGVLKIGIFVLYLALVSNMPEIKRVFQYHGAEHKTIACYEAEEPLTPENIKPCTRFHPRCGTSFMLIVLVISIILFTIVRVDHIVLRMLLKILLLPVVVGISYEIIRYAGGHDNALTRVISKPGLWLQRLTTKEPDVSQIEVAIKAMEAVIPEEKGLDVI